MKFHDPQLLYWILVGPAALLVAYISQKQGLKKLAHFMGKHLQNLWTQHISWSARYWKWTLKALVLVFLAIALARPQIGESQQAVKSEGFEIFFAVDVSESMLAEDLRPSRLDKAKIDLSRLADNLGGHRMGVIAFAGSAAVISPLTQDVAAVKMYVDALDPLTVSSKGTNFESALRIAEEAFDRGGVGGDEPSTVTRVLLIISDGEDHEKGALEKAEDLVKKGIRIFTVAYGTEKGAPIPVRDQMGFLKGYKKDTSGQTVLTTVKGDALKVLAEKGKGFFTFTTSDSSFVTELVAQLNTLEKRQYESELQIQYDEKFQIPLLIAFLLALWELVLQDRKRRKA